MKAPIEMPTLYVAQQEFKLQRVDYMAPEASGRIGGVQAGMPLWSGAWTLGRMPEDDSDDWEAFVDGLRGAARRFIGRDLKRQYPKLYPDGFGAFGAFTGQASSWSQSIVTGGDCQLTLHLGAAASGLVLSKRDGIDFRYNATETSVAGLAWRALVRVVSGGTANGSGVVTVTVEPPIPTAVPGSAVAHIDEPGCVMAPVNDQTTLGPIDRLYSINGGQIVGVQDIRS
jgi:hypothetical protein